MFKSTSFFDKGAITLSFLCAFHCIFMPVILIALPSTSSLVLGDESFHFWMVLIVIPLSIITLLLGCKKHQQNYILGIGLAGLLLLIMAVFLPHEMLSEWGEKLLTLLGASIIAFSHVKNGRLCQAESQCRCHT